MDGLAIMLSRTFAAILIAQSERDPKGDADAAIPERGVRKPRRPTVAMRGPDSGTVTLLMSGRSVASVEARPGRTVHELADELVANYSQSPIIKGR
jgi:hypothetical protein